jgi:hypothetical protein
MPRLIACTSCQAHVRSNEGTCPHCGAAIASDGRLGRTAGAVLMGLTIAGCGPDAGEDTASAGMTASEGSATETPGTSSSGSAEGSHTGDTSSSVSEGTWGEPDYGVPDTGWYEETDDTTGTGAESTGDDTTGGSDSTGGDSTTGGAEEGSTSGGQDDDGPIDTGVEPLYGVGDSGA